MKGYYPKRPVKSFQDLEIYQKTLGLAAVVVKNLMKETIANEKMNDIVNHLTQYLLELPVLIATAHSVRFSSPETAINKLERAMLHCNVAVVYLELYRDIVAPLQKTKKDTGTNNEINYEEQIRILLTCRGKIMRLQMSWKKFMSEKRE